MFKLATTSKQWVLVERLGLILILLGLTGATAVLAPSLLVRYGVQSSSLPILNLPAASGDEAGISTQEYHEQLAVAPRRLLIPDHGIEASIVQDVSLDDEAAYRKALTKGVALARSSAPLDATEGNSFLFGHSGRITLKPSPYDTIFAALPDVKVGESVKLVVDGVTTDFIVITSRSVSADDQTILQDTKDKRTLTLMTCWPLGTWYKRWVVIAEQVSDKHLTPDI